MAIWNATFSVDTFFFLSGLLAAFVTLRKMENSMGRLSLFKFYFHRYWRLTPTYMFVLVFCSKMTGFLGDGPAWFLLQSNENCDKYWWTNLLYINNFYPPKFGDQCMRWGWYLANDMQFYIIAPLILFAAYRFRLRGMLAVVGFFISASLVTTAVISAHYDIKATPLTPQPPGVDLQSLVYSKPYCRIAPYLVGMALGYVLLYTKGRQNFKTYLLEVAGWCFAVILALSVVYSPYTAVKKGDPEPFTRAENIMYLTFARFAWSLALAWVIFACHRGRGGLVDKILSARFWIPLSRMTYCAYLVHVIVLLVGVGSLEALISYSDILISVLFAGVLTISYSVAFIVCVCVETPLMRLENLALN